ncbi:hypothetical protein OG21DRAFT_1135803 [Imleria badia]|nr:hypothetical protein OG21DRAFT_1135803 [Imleria badia]
MVRMATGNPVGVSQEARIVSRLGLSDVHNKPCHTTGSVRRYIRPDTTMKRDLASFRTIVFLTATTVQATYIYGGDEVADLYNQVIPVVFASKELLRLLCDTPFHHTQQWTSSPPSPSRHLLFPLNQKRTSRKYQLTRTPTRGEPTCVSLYELPSSNYPLIVWNLVPLIDYCLFHVASHHRSYLQTYWYHFFAFQPR